MSSTPENRREIGGAACCLIAALAYTTANVAIRQLTALRCDPLWAVFGRESITTLLITPWVIYRLTRGQPTLPSGRTFRYIFLGGVTIQVIGNVCVQWAFGVVGLAVTVPAMFATTITTGAILGWLALGERVSKRSAAAITLLLVALGLLGLGAQAVGKSIAAAEAITTGPLVIALAVAGAGLAGTVYSGLNIVIRHSVTRTTQPLAIAFLVPLSGMLSLGPIALFQSGAPTLPSLSGQELLLMLAAGFFNLIGFVALIHGLKRTTVVYANAVNASQVAMAAVAGMTIFREPPNPWLLLGVGLTIIGIVWIDRPAEAIEDIPPP